LENGVKLYDETEVKDLVVKDGKIQGVKTTKEQIKADKVILAPGRVNARWLQTICDKYGIKYVYDKVEVGVRVEFPASIMRLQAETLYEIVYKVKWAL